MKDKIKQIFNGLKEGEPYQFSLRGNRLIIGIRANFDEKYDEYEIFDCKDVKKIKSGLFKLNGKCYDKIYEFNKKLKSKNGVK